MKYFEWPPQEIYTCDPIPSDACDVNYCPAPIYRLEEVFIGYSSVVTVRVGEDGVDDSYTDHLGSLTKKFPYKFPAIKVITEDTVEWYDGSFAKPIEMPLKQSDKIVYPLIVDSRNQLKHWKPAPTFGKFKIISKKQVISTVPDVFPSLASTFQVESISGEPQFYLGANGSKHACSPGSGSTIQLLKITP